MLQTLLWSRMTCSSTVLKYPLAVLAQTPVAYTLVYCNAFSTTFTAVRCFQLRKTYWDWTLPRIGAQMELSSTFVYDYKMRTSGSSARNSHLTQGGRTTMMPMPVNRITSQCKIKLSQNEWMGIFFLEYYVLLCNTCLNRSVHRQGHHCHSSPLAEVRIARRAAARAHFVVLNKDAGQSYLSFDTR